MLEKILPYERNLFFLINGSHSYFADCVMWLFSGSIIWMPLIVLFLFSIVYKKEWKQWLPILITIAILFLFCDQFSSGICKPFFARLRPTHHPLFMNEVHTLYGYAGGKYGFISSHATNSFGFATLTTLLFRNKFYAGVIFLWAFIMSYSRIYLGVHFISDVVVGAVSGIIIGMLVYQLYLFYLKKTSQTVGVPVYSNHRIKIITITIISYISFFIISSEGIIYLIR